MIPTKVCSEDAFELEKDVTIAKIEETIKSLTNSNSPGANELNSKFYITDIEWIITKLLEEYCYEYKTNALGTNINKGIIKLIPKEGDKTLIKN